MQNQKTENVFEDKSRVPNEQNAWKETQFQSTANKKIPDRIPCLGISVW